ncbi:Rad52/Rad22 family DNA repair protein [Deinococcus aquiradiocola]|uniref:Uncharacterized protein n=1 Tax=Deinococcus aquiradiocola TaxID=393059 RepID=A0A917PBZ2_9DEIO|nr:Rad52/Rad22 family DNA repair protein [Deinococcus aquiradiocola]GGJ70379.1 hypothetical protein GCM10008939_13470 [Deinococcus aquiradiocola]
MTEHRSGLTPAVVRRLRRPFPPATLRWKLQTRPQEGTDPFATVVVYVDVRTVAAHLDDVVPGQWSTEYVLPPVTVGWPAVECRLTVCGVTRSDVGTVEPGARPGSDTKDLYSDALKRAAVQYGVGAFLYRFPQVQARVERAGATWFVTREAHSELAVLTRAVLAGNAALPRFQALRVRGYRPHGVADVTAPGDVPPAIGEVRARSLAAHLQGALTGSAWADAAGETYATYVLGVNVERLADLSEAEAGRVYRAARQEAREMPGPATGGMQVV